MKHLKKLSVVLMLTTLFSVTFTSCIDNQVSDAVDQVYLAQAEFLQAQAALKDAEAQYQLARAASESANAQLILANTAAIEASTAGVIIGNSQTAALNANTLTLAAATLATNLETAAGLLAAAQSANQVAMVTLSNAVAAAKNLLLTSLYGDYTARIAALDLLENGKLVKLTAIATQQLYLSSGGTESMAFIQTQLVANLAALQAGLANAQAEITRLEGLTVDNARQDVTDLQAEIADLKDANAALGVEKYAKENAVTVTKAAWLAASQEYLAVTNKESEISTLEGVIEAHQADIDAAQAAIDEANANVLALPAATAALAAVDTTTAFNAVVAAKLVVTTKQGLVGTNYVTTGATTDDPKITSTPKTVAKAWDNVYNAELLAIQKNATYDSISKYLAPSTTLGYPYVYLNELELNLASAINIVSGTLPASIVAAQAIYDAALLRETAAQAAYNANPGGSTWTDGDDSTVGGPTFFDNTFIGDHTDGLIVTSYKRVATWTELPAASDNWYPATYTVAATIPAIPTSGAITYAIFDATAPISGGDVADVNKVYYVEVEGDDSPTVNVTEMHLARYWAQIAEDNLLILQGNLTGEAQDIADAQLLLDLGYEALGYTVPPVGDPLTSDWNNALALQAAALTASNNAKAAIGYTTTTFGTTITPSYSSAEMATAYYQVVLAEAAVVTAQNALGTDYFPTWSGNSWSSKFEEWLAQGNALVTAYSGTNQYQRLQELVNPTTYARVYDLPHTGASITAYQKLRNAYFQMVWAQEAVEALSVVDYASINNEFSGTGSNGSIDTNAKTIIEATADIADITALLPSHNAALAQLQAELVVLEAAAGSLDNLLFDPNDHSFSYVIDGVTYNNNGTGGVGALGYGPLLVDYLNAIVARNDVQAAMVANVAEQALIQHSIDAIQLYLLGDGTTPVVENVASFELWRKNAINAQKDLINGTGIADGYLKDINQAQVLIDKGLISKADAVLLLAELQRELTVINTQIGIQEDSATSLLARINALLN